MLLTHVVSVGSARLEFGGCRSCCSYSSLFIRILSFLPTVARLLQPSWHRPAQEVPDQWDFLRCNTQTPANRYGLPGNSNNDRVNVPSIAMDTRGSDEVRMVIQLPLPRYLSRWREEVFSETGLVLGEGFTLLQP